MDAGGVTKELFTLAIRKFVTESNLLQLCDDGRHLWFTRTKNVLMESNSFDEYLLGILLGLACYNGVLVNLPIAPVVYKLFNGGRVFIQSPFSKFVILRLQWKICGPSIQLLPGAYSRS